MTELAQHLGASEEDVLEAQELGQAYNLLSLDSELHGDSDKKSQTLADYVGRNDPAMELLEDAAVKQPRVLKDPPPQVLLGSFAGDSMSFELRVWINQTEDWSQIRSELALAVRATLAEHNIAVK